jgi:hypothetical protein
MTSGSWLDCQGHTIRGTGIGAGIRADGVTDIRLIRCRVTGFEDGISFIGSNTAVLERNFVFQNTRYGFLATDGGNIGMFKDVFRGNGSDQTHWERVREVEMENVRFRLSTIPTPGGQAFSSAGQIWSMDTSFFSCYDCFFSPGMITYRKLPDSLSVEKSATSLNHVSVFWD